MLKKLYVALIVVMALLLVVSCAPAETPAPEAPAPSEQEEAKPEEAEEPEPEEVAEKVTLTIESWRNDDLTIWQDVIIPAFNQHYPNIEVIFAPTAPADYNAALNAKLEGGTAGDLITCRPFDQSLGLFDDGYLASLNDLPGMDNFGDVAKSAWVTDDGSTVFCVPMASVIHGFIYNKEIFDELGLEEPKTEAEFFALLDKIKEDGTYVPMDIGTADQWEAATMGFQNIGPNYWQGEEGRLGLIAGTEKFTDPQYVAVWESLAKWNPYLAPGFEAQGYPDSQNLFSLGRAAIYPAGSWDIALFNDQADFEMGAFPPPLPEGADTCYISDHTDIALGMNPKTAHPEAARTFLEWLTTAEFAELYSNQLPGFFSLSKHSVSLTDPVAQEFVDWRGDCGSTIRNSYQILSRGEPNLENELWGVSAQVINGTLTPQEAAQQIQDGLDKWYVPGEAAGPAAPAEKPELEAATLTIESWRNDDLTIWQDVIIPAFNQHYPDIEVIFAPTAPADYNAALNAKLEGGTAGDLITCRPFDQSLGLFDDGHLATLNDLPGMDNFGDVAKSAWVTDDGSTVFCVPMASVIHGFIYNKEIFDELGLEEPKTEAEFFALLDKIKEDGTYVPMDIGTADQWEAATMGFQNIGPNYWQGEEGRLGLIAGTEKFTDPQYVAVWESLAKWNPYLAPGFEAQGYPDSQNLFSLGRAAIYPAGSWDIALFNDQADFEMGAFPPPLPEGADTCYISDHTDIALGMNPKTEHPNEVRAFLEWVTTPEFAELYSNQLPGFFSLSKHSVSLTDPVAQEFVDWRGDCGSTIRNSYQILSRGEPNLENELWGVSAQVINGTLSPEEAAQQIQEGLDKWYTPAEVSAAPAEAEVAINAPLGGFLEKALAGEYAGTEVSVMGVMVEQDGIKFEKSFEPFEEATGIDVVYNGTKEFEAAINVRVDAGDPPDIADFPQPGLLASFARHGKVVDVSQHIDIDHLTSNYNQAWLDMATMDGPDGPIMSGVWHRTAGKSFVWYPKKEFDAAGYQVPTTWDEMLALTQAIADDGDTAWCIGIESGAATGWVATDWLENIMLRTTTPENYDKWVTNELKFASPEVKNSAEIMSEIWLNEDYVSGGTGGIVSTFIGDSPVPMFEDPPRCWLHAQAPWITSFFGEGLEAGVDYDFFTMPPIDETYGTPVLVAGDIMAAFDDRPEVMALMEWFSIGAGVEQWVKAGGAISPHNDSSLDWYTADIDRKVAQAILEADTVRFDASDLMPGEVGAGSFWKAMTDYVSGSVDLDTALQEIDASWPK